MKNSPLYIILLLFISTSCFCQKLTAVDTLIIHKKVIEALKSKSGSLNITPNTDKNHFKDFDFETASSLDTLSTSKKIWNSKKVEILFEEYRYHFNKKLKS